MVRKKIPLLIFLFIFTLLTSTAQAAMSSASFRIPTSVIASGGGSMSSTGFSLTGTLGQLSATPQTSSTTFMLKPGFWFTAYLGLKLGDVNGDGAVDLKDLIHTLQIITGQSPAEIYAEADMNGDGKIGLVEAISILRKVGGL